MGSVEENGDLTWVGWLKEKLDSVTDGTVIGPSIELYKTAYHKGKVSSKVARESIASIEQTNANGVVRYLEAGDLLEMRDHYLKSSRKRQAIRQQMRKVCGAFQLLGEDVDFE